MNKTLEKCYYLEFILFGSLKHLPYCMMDHIDMCGDQVPKSDKIKLLGTWLDSNLNLKHYINLKCRMVMLNIQKIKHVINVLTSDAASFIVNGVVTSDLNYANALYCGLPESSMKKLHTVLNMAAKVILRKMK